MNGDNFKKFMDDISKDQSMFMECCKILGFRLKEGYDITKQSPSSRYVMIDTITHCFEEMSEREIIFKIKPLFEKYGYNFTIEDYQQYKKNYPSFAAMSDKHSDEFDSGDKELIRESFKKHPVGAVCIVLFIVYILIFYIRLIISYLWGYM